MVSKSERSLLRINTHWSSPYHICRILSYSSRLSKKYRAPMSSDVAEVERQSGNWRGAPKLWDDIKNLNIESAPALQVAGACNHAMMWKSSKLQIGLNPGVELNLFNDQGTWAETAATSLPKMSAFSQPSKHYFSRLGFCQIFLKNTVGIYGYFVASGGGKFEWGFSTMK